MVEDVADRLDDLICAWDKVVGTDVETVVVLLGKLLHNKKSSTMSKLQDGLYLVVSSSSSPILSTPLLEQLT